MTTDWLPETASCNTVNNESTIAYIRGFKVSFNESRKETIWILQRGNEGKREEWTKQQLQDGSLLLTKGTAQHAN